MQAFSSGESAKINYETSTAVSNSVASPLPSRPVFLATRQVEVHEEASCDGCEKSPLWGQRYSCASCPDSDFCSLCVATIPHESDHVFHLVPGSAKNVSALSADVAARMAETMVASEIHQMLRGLGSADVRMDRFIDEETAPAIEVGQKTEEELYGAVGHPLLRLIPNGLERLSRDATSEENASVLKEAIPQLQAFLSTSDEESLLPSKNMDLESLLELWADLLAKYVPAPHLIQFGMELIDMLELPHSHENMPLSHHKSSSLLPSFLITDGDDPDHPHFYGKKLLICSWLLILSTVSGDKMHFSALPDDAVIKFMMSDEEPEELVVENCSAFGETECLYFVPLPEMKKVRKPCRQQDCVWQHAQPDEDWKIAVFVSHAWHTPEHPDPEGKDWKQVQDFLWRAIIAMVDTISLMAFVGVRQKVMKERLGASRQVVGNIEQPAGGGLITADLFCDLARCSIEEADSEIKLDAASRKEWCSRIARRVQVWFDFMSLPQSPRSTDEDALFRRTLSNLAQLQARMHTLIVSLDSGYQKRAWCVAEWINGKHISTSMTFDGQDDIRGDALPLGPQQITKMLDAFRALTNPDIFDTEEVLNSLGLRITNGKSDSETVCMILWEGSRLAPERYWLCDSRQETVLLGRGTLEEVAASIGRMYAEGFRSEMFHSLPAVAGQPKTDTKQQNKNRPHVSIYWLVHETLKKEDGGKCFKRDLGGLHVVVSALERIGEFPDLEVVAGFTCTTKVKLEENALLCGYSCDEIVCNIADFVIPMRGSAMQRTIFTNMQQYQQSFKRWLQRSESTQTNGSDEEENEEGGRSSVTVS